MQECISTKHYNKQTPDDQGKNRDPQVFRINMKEFNLDISDYIYTHTHYIIDRKPMKVFS